MDNKKFIRVNGKRFRTRLYGIWIGMRQRCRDKNNDRYGGRGIFVCNAWNDFYTFHAWAKANGYRGDLSIDRIKVNDGYYPKNCRWANKWVQVDNRSVSILITYKGEEKSVRAWAKSVGLTRDTLYHRIYVYEWGYEYSLTAPLYAPAPPWAKKKKKEKETTKRFRFLIKGEVDGKRI